MKLPAPHPNELIYSTVARAGVYFGVVSPKQLLDDVFADRKVIATLDLPSHLQSIALRLSETGQYDLETLVYKHTLFPLYAPFVTEQIRQRTMNLMAGCSIGAVHLMLGVAASRIKSVRTFRFCPLCMEKQFQTYGENFWQRDWFLPGIPVCPEHGTLKISQQHVDEHRHQFLPLISSYLKETTNSERFASDLILAKAASDLLEQPPQISPSFEQWTHFYYVLAAECGFTRGKQIDHAKIFDMVCSRMGIDYLESTGLLANVKQESYWLKSIFRKHRKSFSFFEHLIVWSAMQPDASITDIFAKLNAFSHVGRENHKLPNVSNSELSDECREYRQQWESLALQHGVKPARYQSNGGALYAWLYRHDRDWLLSFNEQKKKPQKTINRRVDWHKRDLQIAKNLIRILLSSEKVLPSQRMSALWFIKQLPHKNSVAKKLNKLPLTQQFLVRYSESVTEYQLRRISQYIVNAKEKNIEIRHWQLFRNVGLSDQRITPDTMKILDSVSYL
jgi:hypothetical protein